MDKEAQPACSATVREATRAATRKAAREARRNLSGHAQATASAELLSLVSAQDFFQNASRLAFYQSLDGEIDPHPLIEHSLHQGKDCFLPVITRDGSQPLIFAPFDFDTVLVKNEWGILEPPVPKEPVPPATFDVVFVPLVAFDASCSRLGMGKGCYDRTFSFRISSQSSQPLLVGLAHECQFTEPLPTEAWDVRLDAVVTPNKMYRPDTP